MSLFFGRPLEHYLIIAAILFCLGLFTVMTRRNAVGMLMGVELMLNAANINLVAFSKWGAKPVIDGHIFVMFVIILAAAEAAVALAIILSIFRNFGDVDVDSKTLMKE